ncbi:Iron import ATP-binding/permease protein IrtB [Serratia entomophila]|nr:Iron import ATP-binding/permease protein IrtB [Serratia entomophila]CAI1670721.1 Iron import ATP-binding/permease protein IrtB [Serratia entomophila]CAI1729631.1 Iron import ATP-binding/permease protein IrtB [Serratia entomophila]CAI1747484.1 Iron import ATP-binding/permease protein IrtB [Serratia entomophila]CAI1815329.1 Iron import ATP-binding/permease protein IrtB [Serratia entomophila]
MSEKNENKERTITKVPQWNVVHFENVFFTYDGKHDVLKGVNLSIHKGEHISLVGENGAGKSTLIKLLCGLYQPTKGRITVDGIDISKIDRDVWWSMFSTVFQDFGRYNLTLRENVVIGDVKLKNDDEAVLLACNVANFKLYGAIGLSTFLGKAYSGTELSGGQWQRLALARALLSNRAFVIMDEPTSSMDPRVENALFNKFADLIEGKTSIMVTHRMGAIRKTDKIIVLKEGKIIEQGSIEELEALNGEYSELYNLQRNQCL